jgi:ankyrin repeat protein
LHAAAEAGHIEVVHTLLLYGWALEARTSKGSTALHLAAVAGHVDVCRLLLGCGISHAVVNSEGRTPLHAAAAFGYTAVIHLLVESGADVNAADSKGRAPIHWAAGKGHAAAVAALVKAGAAAGSTCQGSTALHAAAALGNLSVVCVLLGAAAPVDAVDSLGRTPLQRASNGGHGDVVKELLRAGARPDKQSHTGGVALHYAVEGNRAGVVQVLLEVQAVVADIDAATNTGQTPLHVACWLGHSDIVPLLLAHGANMRAVTAAGYNPLRMAVMRQHLAVVRILLAAGVDPCVAAPSTRTMLHEAAWTGNKAIMQELLAAMSADQRRAAVNMCNKGLTPLHCAVEKGSQGCVEVLVAAEADASKLYGADARTAAGQSFVGATVLHRAVQLGRAAAVPLLATPHNMRRMWKGGTPLHMALAAGQAEIAQALLAAGSPAGLRDTAGDTAMCLAACSGSAALRLLLPGMISREWVGDQQQQQQQQGGVVQDPAAGPLAVCQGLCALLGGPLEQPEQADGPTQPPQLLAACFEAVLEVGGVAEASSLLELVMRICQDEPGASCFASQLVLALHSRWLVALDPLMQVRWKWANRLQRLVLQQQQWRSVGWCILAFLGWQRVVDPVALALRTEAAAYAHRWQLFVQLLEQLTGLEPQGQPTALQPQALVTKVLLSVTQHLGSSAQLSGAAGLCEALLQAWWDAKQNAARRGVREAADVVVRAVQAGQCRQPHHAYQYLSKLLLVACAVLQRAGAAVSKAVDLCLCALVAWLYVVLLLFAWLLGL